VKVYRNESISSVSLHSLHHNSLTSAVLECKIYDEIFYCIKGSVCGIIEDREIELVVGQAFIVPAGVMHSLRTDNNLYVSSFLIPVIE